MQYTSHYSSPLGELLLAADGGGLTGLWFEGQKYFAHGLDRDHQEGETQLLTQAKRWLDLYFAGKAPEPTLPLHLTGTPFQREVWEVLRTIPYGQTTTYGAIAAQLAGKRGLPQMSARAVGGAVGRNRLSILVPCHRVVGARGSLTGYAGGLDRKRGLLKLEQEGPERLSVPGPSDRFQVDPV